MATSLDICTNSFAVKNGKRPIQGIPTNRNPNRFTNVEKASVVEHAPVPFVMLAEFGGRSEAANRVIGKSVSSAGHQLVEVLPNEDGLALWKYNNKVEQVVDFARERSHQSNRARTDWDTAERHLRESARVSGGRSYTPR